MPTAFYCLERPNRGIAPYLVTSAQNDLTFTPAQAAVQSPLWKRSSVQIATLPGFRRSPE